MAGVAALILAGGSAVRFGGDIPKQYLALAGRAVLRHSAETFASHPEIDAVRVIIRDQDRAHYDRALAGLDILDPVTGGATRQDSSRLGLESLATLAPNRVLIHDAARPLIDPATISRVLTALEANAAVLPALPVTDTLKRAAEPAVDGAPVSSTVGGTVSRDGLWRAQTPQGFRFDDIVNAHRASAGGELTDDAAVAENAGLAVALVMGDEDNMKVTMPEDFDRAERLLAGRLGEIRIGTGFDVHQFGPGDHVILCGVRIAADQGLVGHSDADVGLHALTDAILGAAAQGDIGTHFPPSDPQWRDAASDSFLRHAASLVTDLGGRIVNVDVTLICETPKIGPHRAAMIRRIADILQIDVGRVSIKATTTERLGFTGRGEGIAAQAAASIRLAN
jgi:2-C-methyl-D-erythritol 4-phosphate cytidylyltransferase / 2-C-methyl-D-erythritol 2,4-cyclodiphosphate synthase